MPHLPSPVLVISYSDDTRAAVAASLAQYGVSSVPCATFGEAEEFALQSVFSGVIVDIPSIVRARNEEKTIAYTLAGFFPTLRVRAMGSMLVPMTMPGEAKQDRSLGDFLTKTCAAFRSRKLRSHRRHDNCLPIVMSRSGIEERSFTLNISWSGAFVVDTQPERFSIGEEIDLLFPEFELTTRVTVRWIQPWGGRRVPGIGVLFRQEDEKLDAELSKLFQNGRESDRDRLHT